MSSPNSTSIKFILKLELWNNQRKFTEPSNETALQTQNICYAHTNANQFLNDDSEIQGSASVGGAVNLGNRFGCLGLVIKVLKWKSEFDIN